APGGGVGEGAGKPGAGSLGGRGQEAVQLAGQPGERSVQPWGARLEAPDPLKDRAAGQEAVPEQRQLAPRHEDHIRAGPAQMLSTARAIFEYRSELVGGQVPP